MSYVEWRLWQRLRSNQIDGHHFTKQYEIGPYHADFICRTAKLVVEVDGPSHDSTQVRDAARDRFMQGLGYRVLRFTNAEVLEDSEGVIFIIAKALADTPSPSPSRKREGS